ncbi:TPA: hypothetical protein HA371_02525 [Candidatus Woesearchaeota archaeon]|nr:hypothetical protein [Candidatus Woesearchaeota archaeon]
METTIQISRDLLEQLKKRKMGNGESYERVIWDLLEDTMELSDETKQAIVEGRRQIQEGKVISFENLKREFR